MRRWLLPILAGLIVAGGAYYVALLRTPDVLMTAAIKRVSAGGVNRFTHSPLATAAARKIVRPSPDLAYSSCPFDVSDGPVLIDAVPVPAPYWSLSIFDSRTDTVFVRNALQAKGMPFKLAIARAGQVVPAGYEAVQVGGDRGIALVRVLVTDRARFATLDATRRTTTCGPLE
ncbi:hypothetical protein ASG11_14685 [Sphingomonas sp. Leaf357]|uniref:DUF1254 domain-containing protein n=1 Tax=Sphingomonas sp. Leaf357 TaxID=1736350 RepID=UPI0006FFA696|nr:DUF1254 domain-containing protein [Sphingomonas sp. Leaf357]KQS02046.1 hypothetical protein ASG11_14685 [Sphingomonas sp. Leaf357]